MAKQQLETAHIATVAYAAGGHAVTQTVQRDVRQAETANQRTVSMIEAGRRDAVDVAGQLPIMAKPGHKLRRHRHGSNAGTRFGRRIDDLTAVKSLSLVGNHQFRRIPRHILPSEAADFAPTQAEDDSEGQSEAMRMDGESGHVGRDLII